MWKKLICTVLLTLLLAGCQAESDQATPLTDALLANIYTPSTSASANYVIAQKNGMSYRKVNGKCYLSLGKNDSKIDPHLFDGHSAIPLGSLEFESVEQAYQTLVSCNFTEEQIFTIRFGFPLEHGLGFVMPEPSRFLTLLLPEDMQITRVCIQGDRRYNIWFRVKNVTSQRPLHGDFEIISKQEFEQFLENRSKFENNQLNYPVIKTALPEKNAVQYNFTNANANRCQIHYAVKESDRVMMVTEFYNISHPQDETGSASKPSSVSVYGYDHGVYYRISISNLSKAPSAEWLKEFRPTAYPG